MPLMQPLAKDSHVNAMLTNIALGYTNLDYIADRIFPIVQVDKQTDIIPEYNQDYWMRNDAGLVGEGGVASSAGYKVTKTDTYYCHDYGIRHFISDQRRVNEDDPFNSDRDGTMFIMEKIRLLREVQFVTDFWKASVWTTDITGGTTVPRWSDFGGSDPIVDVRTYKRTIRRLIGRDPNTLVLGDLTFDKLCDHPDFMDRIKYGHDADRPAEVTENAMAQLFGVNTLLVGKAIYTTTVEGSSSFTYTSLYDDDALLLYLPPGPAIFSPSAGYTFVWRASDAVANAIEWIRKYRDDIRLGDFIEARSWFDQKLTKAQAGAFFDDITN